VAGRAKVSSCTSAQLALGCIPDAENSSYLGGGGPAVHAVMNAPQCVASDSIGNLYIADTGNNAIRYVACASGNTACASAPNAGVITTIAGGQSTAGDAYAKKAGAPGMGAPLDGRSGTAPGGNYLSDGPALLAYFNTPKGIALDSKGNVYVADYGNTVVRVLIPGAAGGGYTVATLLGNQSSANDDAPGIPTGTNVGTVPVTNRLRNNTSVALDAAGNVYVAVTSTSPMEGRVVMVTADWLGEYGLAGIANTTITGLDAGTTYNSSNAFQLETPNALGIAVDAKGNVYVSDRKNLVKKLVPPAKYTTYPNVPNPLTANH